VQAIATALRGTGHHARSLTAAALLVAAAGPLPAQRRPPPVGAGRAAAQVGAGVLGTPIGFFGGGLATRWAAARFGAGEDRASTVGLVGAYSGAALVAAAGPTLVGAGPHATSTYWDALAGAVVGEAGSVVLARLNRAVDLGAVPRIVSAIAVFALPGVGAALGYDLGRRPR